VHRILCSLCRQLPAQTDAAALQNGVQRRRFQDCRVGELSSHICADCVTTVDAYVGAAARRNNILHSTVSAEQQLMDVFAQALLYTLSVEVASRREGRIFACLVSCNLDGCCQKVPQHALCRNHTGSSLSAVSCELRDHQSTTACSAHSHDLLHVAAEIIPYQISAETTHVSIAETTHAEGHGCNRSPQLLCFQSSAAHLCRVAW
jgi:hypothetical protein